MIDRISCPYCNTSFVPPGTAALKVPCPRCGEAVPVPPSAEPVAVLALGHIPVESANGALTEPHPPEPPAVARALRPLAGIGLVLLLIALGAGAAALFLRPPPQPPAPPKPATTWPPTAVPGLAYLPADATVVAAVQPRAIKQFAERKGVDPTASPELPEVVRSAFDKLGLRPEQVEAVVAGAVIRDNNPLPPLVVVLTVTPPFDEAALLKGLKADRDPDAPGRYKADLGGLPVFVAKAGDGVFVAATRPADVEGLAARAARGGAHLSSDVRDSMSRLSPASVAWATTGVAAWADKPELKLWASLLKRPDAVKLLAGATAGAIGLSLEPDPKLLAAVRSETAILPDLKARLADGLGESATIRDDGDWLTAERPVTLPGGTRPSP